MKLWNGRFSKAATSSANEFNASIEFDQRMYRQDIQGSLAHAKMLEKQGILSKEDYIAIKDGLTQILQDIEDGKVTFTIEQEDIHMNIESLLTERIGAAGKRLHTARSRNDQVAVDIRLYLKEEIKEILKKSIEDFHLPRYEEIPDVGLYLDQTTTFISGYLKSLEGVSITGSMISNYVKKKLFAQNSFTQDIQIFYIHSAHPDISLHSI